MVSNYAYQIVGGAGCQHNPSPRSAKFGFAAIADGLQFFRGLVTPTRQVRWANEQSHKSPQEPARVKSKYICYVFI